MCAWQTFVYQRTVEQSQTGPSGSILTVVNETTTIRQHQLAPPDWIDRNPLKTFNTNRKLGPGTRKGLAKDPIKLRFLLYACREGQMIIDRAPDRTETLIYVPVGSEWPVVAVSSREDSGSRRKRVDGV